jgi:hypothetical protein
MAQQLPGYMQLMTQLYFDLLNGLSDIRSAYEETYFRGLLATAKGDGDAVVIVMLQGRSGTTSAASLSITNTTGKRTRIGHEVVDVRRVDGASPSIVPAIMFAPETLELDPNEERTLTISLHLDPEQYDADTLYSGALLLTGSSDVPLQVELRILATSGASKDSDGQG